MYLQVPKEGLDIELFSELRVANAHMEDVEDMEELENKLCGIERKKDFQYFIENKKGIWKTVLCRNDQGQLLGFLSSVDHPACRMIGPGVAEDEKVAISMLATQLENFRGKTPVFLLPVTAKLAVQAAYSWGARNCEIHFSQCHGDHQPPKGVVMPTFMPESS